MDYEGVFFAITEATITADRLKGWQTSLSADANGVWDNIAFELARRFLDGRFTFEEADQISNRLWYWMVTHTASEHSLPSAAMDVFLAFDSGESAPIGVSDPVATFTIPQLQSVLGRIS